MDFLYNLLVLIFDFLYFFLQILELLVQVRYLLSSPRVPLIVNSSRRSYISLVSNCVELVAFSKPLAHLK